jgi:hypothetical protein
MGRLLGRQIQSRLLASALAIEFLQRHKLRSPKMFWKPHPVPYIPAFMRLDFLSAKANVSSAWGFHEYGIASKRACA